MGVSTLKAQIRITKDPLLKYKNFLEIGASVNGTRVNTLQSHFETSTGSYDIFKAQYIPTVDGLIYYGWIFKNRHNNIYTLKTGINLTTRGSNLRNSEGNTMRYKEGVIEIPIIFGFRFANKFMTVKNNLFGAADLNLGLYASTPYNEKLVLRNDIDSKGTFSFGNYIKFGVTSEFVFSRLNIKGNGHKIGIRASFDFNSVIKIKETKHGINPYYNSIGICYYIMNRYQ